MDGTARHPDTRLWKGSDGDLYQSASTSFLVVPINTIQFSGLKSGSNLLH